MFNKFNQILKNNTIFTASKIDGFLVAVISSPNLIHTRKWVKITTIKDGDLDLLFELYNKIYFDLSNGHYVPIFVDSDLQDLSTNLNKWIDGYILGKNLWDPKIVKIYQLEIDQLFSMITRLSANFIKIPNHSNKILSKACMEIYRFWLNNYSEAKKIDFKV